MDKKFSSGHYLKQGLADANITPAQFSLFIGWPLSKVELVLSGREPLTEEMCKQLAAYFGNSAELWQRLERDYRASL